MTWYSLFVLKVSLNSNQPALLTMDESVSVFIQTNPANVIADNNMDWTRDRIEQLFGLPPENRRVDVGSQTENQSIHQPAARDPQSTHRPAARTDASSQNERQPGTGVTVHGDWVNCGEIHFHFWQVVFFIIFITAVYFLYNFCSS